MKKLLFVLAALLITGAANAQFSFGPKIGVNLSQVTTNLNTINDQMKTGLQIGAFVRVGSKVYLQPEFLYSTGGVKLSNVPIGSPTNINVKSIDVPLMLGTRVINLKVANLRLMAGPVASFIVDKQVDYNGAVTATKEVSIKNANWKAQFGAGLDILMFSLDVRYSYDLNNSMEQQAKEFNWEKNSVNVTLGWKLF
ncbi:MAG: PorT family protein [Bacteroidetes bacterium]|nr:PorT family protein [Bacteroidota bacterium]